MADERFVDKVQKLLAKAESTNSEAEAEALFAKATELMQRHMIDEVMLAEARGIRTDEITDISFPLGSTYWQAWRSAGASVGTAFGFRCVAATGKNGRMWWYGWRSELSPAEQIWTSLMIQAERFAREFMRTYRSPDWFDAAEAREDRYKAKRSFLISFGLQVGSRIREQRETTRREVSQEHGSSDLLPVLVSRDDQLDRYYENLGFNKGRRSQLSYNSAGLAAGYEAGRQADLGQTQVAGSRGSLGGGA